MTRVVTAGEAMALLDPEREGELELGDRLRLRFAGAESNFAIALARLEVPAEGVDVRWVRASRDAPIGLFWCPASVAARGGQPWSSP